ncbi:hypothetical protein OKW34_000063 [Paraburkholderia youngii]
MPKHRLILAVLVFSSATASAQYDGAYYTWRHGDRLTCGPTAPNPSWQRVDGPYFDGDCTQKLPVRPAAPVPASAASEGMSE